MITNEQIETLEREISKKSQDARVEDRKRRDHLESLNALKFTVRSVENTPAEYRNEVDPNDESKTIKILVRPATMKSVFDIPPKSQDEPSKDLAETIREKRFNTIKALY